MDHTGQVFDNVVVIGFPGMDHTGQVFDNVVVIGHGGLVKDVKQPFDGATGRRRFTATCTQGRLASATSACTTTSGRSAVTSGDPDTTSGTTGNAAPTTIEAKYCQEKIVNELFHSALCS